jgi:hypothetical protein
MRRLAPELLFNWVLLALLNTLVLDVGQLLLRVLLFSKKPLRAGQVLFLALLLVTWAGSHLDCATLTSFLSLHYT